MQSWQDMSRRRKLAIGATVLAVLAVGGGIVAAYQFGDDEPAEKPPVRTQDEPRATTKPVGKPLELGEVANVSDNYRVAVTEVSTYELAKGLLLVPTIEVTYTGSEDGEPWADLTVEFSSSSGRTFGETDCIAGLGDADGEDRPPLADGDTDTHEVCIELPTRKTSGGRVYVDETYSTDDRVSWSTDEVVVKALPTVVRQQPGGPGPSFRAPPSGSSKKLSEVCEKWDHDEYEDYKEWGEWVEKEYEKYRDAGGDDDDKIEDYEEWRDDYDDQIAYFDKWDKVC
jgi:hypothetical protein